MRARIDVSEIEAQTKIRAKYLRALENEEWDLLPGPTFVRSFLRTYAQALGLDDKPLVDEYRRRSEPPPDFDRQPVVSSARRSSQRGGRGGRTGPSRRPSRGYTIVFAIFVVVIVLLAIGLLTGGKGSKPPKTTSGSHTTATHARTHRHSSASSKGPRSAARASLSLHPSGPIYVCLIGDGGRKVIAGEILQPSYTPVVYHAKRFQITLGNDAITMYVNGKPRTVPPSSKAIGYSITGEGRHTLPQEQLPTCK
jgi:cytoskeleton protein RodZ